MTIPRDFRVVGEKIELRIKGTTRKTGMGRAKGPTLVLSSLQVPNN
jgi:hypothetical protein